MNIVMLTRFFMWCSIIHIGLMALSFLMLLPGGDWVYRLHRRWFPMPRETFNALIYGFLGTYKILALVFCIVPWIALLLTV